MMKTKHKIISLSILAGIGYWIVDAVFDFFFFYEGSFLDLLIFDVPAHEIYLRSVGIGLFFTFGIILSKIMIKHQRAEKKLKKSEEEQQLLSSMVKQSDEGMALVDLNGNLLFLNDAFAAMHGYTSEELLGKHLSIFHTQEQMPSVEAAKRQTQDTGSFNGEIWHVRRDGTIFPTLMHNSLLYDEEGNPIGMIAVAKDITERKRMEDELKLKDHAIATSINGIGFADLEGKIIYVNSSYLKIYGYDNKSEVLGKSVLEFAFDKKVAMKIFKIVQKEGGWIGEMIAKKKDGSAFHVQITITMVRDKHNKPICMMSSFIDITERKRIDELLRESEQKYSTLVEQAKDGVTIEQGDTFVFVNKASAEISGYTIEELIKKPFIELIVPESKESVIENHKLQLAGKKVSAYYESKIICKLIVI